MASVFDDEDIVAGDSPGGSSISRSISIDSLEFVLAGCPRDAERSEYEDAAIERNLLGKQTYEGRRRAFRGLRELYLMDSTRILFRALRDLWFENSGAHAQLAGLSAFARDSTFRATGDAVLAAEVGTVVTPDQIASALNRAFPSSYREETLQKSARNTASSWTQVGHLAGRTAKRRVRIEATPEGLAYAMLLGHLQGLRGQQLLESEWVRFLDLNAGAATKLAEVAARSRYIEYKSGGGVVEVGFHHLLRDRVTA